MTPLEQARIRRRLTQYAISHRYTVKAAWYLPNPYVWVSEQIAAHVAQLEVEAYKDTLEGYYGRRAQVFALTAGLRGIVERRTLERHPGEGPAYRCNGWRVVDACTGERYWRPVDGFPLGVAVGDGYYDAVLAYRSRSMTLAAMAIEQLNPPHGSLHLRHGQVAYWHDSQWHYNTDDERERFYIDYRPEFERMPNLIGAHVWSIDSACVFRGKRNVSI